MLLMMMMIVSRGPVISTVSTVKVNSNIIPHVESLARWVPHEKREDTQNKWLVLAWWPPLDNKPANKLLRGIVRTRLGNQFDLMVVRRFGHFGMRTIARLRFGLVEWESKFPCCLPAYPPIRSSVQAQTRSESIRASRYCMIMTR